jgi:hypothetical protein
VSPDCEHCNHGGDGLWVAVHDKTNRTALAYASLPEFTFNNAAT